MHAHLHPPLVRAGPIIHQPDPLVREPFDGVLSFVDRLQSHRWLIARVAVYQPTTYPKMPAMLSVSDSASGSGSLAPTIVCAGFGV
jgi:hypothetical protein